MNPLNKDTESEGDAFVALGFTLEDIANPDTRINKEICLCGHAISKHQTYSDGSVNCYPAKMWCPCVTAQTAIEVQDVRHFLHKTRGFGRFHALGLGLASLSKSGKWSKLLVDRVCRLCHEPTESLWPVAINIVGRISRKPEQLNGLICGECLQKLNGIR